MAGGEYGWGTWKAVLVQQPSRTAVYAGKLAVLAAAALAVVLAVLAAGAAAAALIALAESQPLRWPPVFDLLVRVAAAWLVAAMWALLGATLAIGLRGVALPAGLGLVWLLAVQNLLTLVAAPLLDWVATVQRALPGPNAGALVAALGAGTDTPGVAQNRARGAASGSRRCCRCPG